jgi:hypothetical protein
MDCGSESRRPRAHARKSSPHAPRARLAYGACQHQTPLVHTPRLTPRLLHLEPLGYLQYLQAGQHAGLKYRPEYLNFGKPGRTDWQVAKLRRCDGPGVGLRLGTTRQPGPVEEYLAASCAAHATDVRTY